MFCIVAIWVQIPDDFWILNTPSVPKRNTKIRVVHSNSNQIFAVKTISYSQQNPRNTQAHFTYQNQWRNKIIRTNRHVMAQRQMRSIEVYVVHCTVFSFAWLGEPSNGALCSPHAGRVRPAVQEPPMRSTAGEQVRSLSLLLSTYIYITFVLNWSLILLL